MVMDNLLNTLFGPLLLLPPLFAVLLVSLFISLLSLVITKYTTNQHVMKDLKDQLKAYQAQIKTLKNEPQKAMDVKKKAMDVNMQYMMHNMRATLFTFLPIILIFGWMSGHFSLMPLVTNEEFSMTLTLLQKNSTTTIHVPEGIILTTNETKIANDEKIMYTMKAEKEGEYRIDFTIGEKNYYHTVIIGQTRTAFVAEKSIKDNILQEIRVNYKPLKIITFPFTLPLFGEYLGWLGTYIIFVILFSTVLRKWLGVH